MRIPVNPSLVSQILIMTTSDEAVRAVAVALDAEVKIRQHDGHHWLRAEVITNGVLVQVSGPHHEDAELTIAPDGPAIEIATEET